MGSCSKIERRIMTMPNVRKLYIPDPGMTFFDGDLTSADLYTVVWESNCRLMKEWLSLSLDPYMMIAREYYHEPDLLKIDPRRRKFKSLCHATNYFGLAKNIAGNSNIGLSIDEVARVQAWYFRLCPEIKGWQEALKTSFEETREVRNAFGYRYKFLGRVDSNTINKMAAWIPQSTAAIVINHAMVAIDAGLPEVQLLLQVHDSLAGQYPTGRPELRDDILNLSRVIVPYTDPMIIPVGIKTSNMSWGDCK
jgi:DNA polymerase-1